MGEWFPGLLKQLRNNTLKAKKWIRESIAWRQNTKHTNTINHREGNAVRQVGTWSVGGLPSSTQPQVGSSTSVGDLTFWHWDIGGWHTWHSLRAGDAYSMIQGQGFELLLLLALQIFRRNICKQIHFTQHWNIYPPCVYFLSLNWHWWPLITKTEIPGCCQNMKYDGRDK